jgi:hypothetical protein
MREFIPMPDSHGNYLVTKGPYEGLKFRVHGGWFGGRGPVFFPVIDEREVIGELTPDVIMGIRDRSVSGVCRAMERMLYGEIKMVGDSGRLYDYLSHKYKSPK